MDIKRIALFALLFALGLNLYQAWNKDYPTTTGLNPQVTTPAPTSSIGSSLLPSRLDETRSASPEQHPSSEVAQASPSGKRITIENDVLRLTVDLNQGEIVDAHLLKYARSIKDKRPFKLLMDGNQHRYVALSTLFESSKQGDATIVGQDYHANRDNYVLQSGKDKVSATLIAKDDNGLAVKKVISLQRGDYLVDIQFLVSNQGGEAQKLRLGTQLLQTNPSLDQSSMFHVGSYTGAAISDPAAKRYQKVPFKEIKREPIQRQVEGGWVAMQQHYFLSAWVPPAESTSTLYSRYVDDQYIIGTVSQPKSLPAQGKASFSSRLYLGPEIPSVLKTIAPGLDLTVDYGVLSVISSFIFSVMSLIHALVGNWGWSIVLVTVFIKLAFFQLSAKSYRSMAMMRQLQPKLAALKQRCGDDRVRLSQETMALYRQEKINPLGGCLPIVIQIPVFISLYWVLLESVQLRQAPWILWVHDLSEPDPYYILPVLMGLTMFIQQRLSPTPPDPAQAKVMMLLPIFFTFLFSHFPSGLVLYWAVNNGLSILQQWFITRRLGGSNKGSKKKVLTGLVAANET